MLVCPCLCDSIRQSRPLNCEHKHYTRLGLQPSERASLIGPSIRCFRHDRFVLNRVSVSLSPLQVMPPPAWGLLAVTLLVLPCRGDVALFREYMQKFNKVYEDPREFQQR
jgi:hypothetical protein